MNLFNEIRAHLLVLFIIAFGSVLTPPVQAQISAMTNDGWHTWRVPAVLNGRRSS